MQDNRRAGNPKTLTVQIRSLRAVEWVKALKPHLTDRQAAQYLKQLNHPRLRTSIGSADYNFSIGDRHEVAELDRS